VSGNPAGMRNGIPHKISSTVSKMMYPVTAAVMQKIIDGCMANDLDCIRIFCALLPRSRNFVAMPINLSPPTNATQALEQIALIVSKMLGGLIDIDSANAAINGLKVYIAGLGDSTFEEKLRRLEQLTQNQSAIFGDASGCSNEQPVNGHDTSETQLHNGHDANAPCAYNGNGAEP
jgi:hypothetical protein